MLSSSRKYKFFLTIAEQSTKQQEDNKDSNDPAQAESDK
jgi:hypothetical protein